MSEKSTPRVLMNFRIPADLAEFMRQHATERETTMTQLIIDYFETLRGRGDKDGEVG